MPPAASCDRGAAAGGASGHGGANLTVWRARAHCRNGSACLLLPWPPRKLQSLPTVGSSDRSVRIGMHGAAGTSILVRQQRQLIIVRGAAVAAAASTSAAVWMQPLIGIRIFILSVSLSVFLLSALKTLKAFQMAAIQLEVVLTLLERELPDTMTAMRLSSLDVSDCVEEFTGLGSDLASGLRASANAVFAAESGLLQAARLVQNRIIPGLDKNFPAARDLIEAGLRQRANLEYTKPLVSRATQNATTQVRAVRTVLAAMNLGGRVAKLLRASNGFKVKPSSVYQLDRNIPPLPKGNSSNYLQEDGHGAEDLGNETKKSMAG